MSLPLSASKIRLLVFSSLILMLGATPLCGADVELTTDAKIHLASLDEARELLSSRDEFALTLSPFDRQVRMQTDQEVTLEAWLKFTSAEARDWKAGEIERVTAAIDDLRPRLARFHFQLPKTILLIRTTGKEEAEAAYTRQAAIILPDKVLDRPPDQLQPLLVHELFHIISRHDPALREKLYALVGFRPCDEIKLPPEWDARRITNPDAPKVDCHIELAVEGNTLTAAPFLFATPAKFDAQKGGSLFKYLTFKLLVLRRDGDRQVAALQDGKPVVLDPRGIEDFTRQIGKNTTYIIHPDEILADNFVLLVRGGSNVPTPRIPEEMGKLMAK